MEQKEQSSERLVLKGAFLLAVSSGIVKVLSAVYKIPLYRMVGDSVMGYYSTAFNIYTVLLTLATAGLPVAMSRMVATANALERRNEPKRIFLIAICTYGLFSLIVSTLMFIFSGEIASLMNNPGASLAVKAIAPAIFIVTCGAAIKGYYQGNQNMMPTSVANIIEALMKLATGFILAAVFGALYPGQSQIIAGGTIICAAAGGFSALLFLIILTLTKLAKRRKSGIYADQRCVPSTPYKKLTKSFFAISLPIMVGSLSTTLAGAVDNYLIIGRFKDIGMAEEAANSIWGAYSTMAGTIYTLPTFIILAVAASIIPAVSTHFTLRDKDQIKKDIDLAGRISGVVVFPIACGVAVLPEPILRFLYGDSPYIADVAGSLIFLCIAMVFLAFTNCFTGILQAINKQHIPVINIIISLVIKTGVAYILLGIPGMGLKGAAVSTLVSMLVFVILNSAALIRHTGMFPSPVAAILKPFGSAAVAAVFGLGAHYLAEYVGKGAHPSVSMLVAVAVAALIYVVMLLITRTITKSDIKLLSKSNKNKKNP